MDTSRQVTPGRLRRLTEELVEEQLGVIERSSIPDVLVDEVDYAPPVFDGPAIAAQARFDEIDGVDGIHYCGAWWGYGFHEDGMVSGLRVCERIGALEPAA